MHGQGGMHRFSHFKHCAAKKRILPYFYSHLRFFFHPAVLASFLTFSVTWFLSLFLIHLFRSPSHRLWKCDCGRFFNNIWHVYMPNGMAKGMGPISNERQKRIYRHSLLNRHNHLKTKQQATLSVQFQQINIYNLTHQSNDFNSCWSWTETKLNESVH
jgi:hypothetical protein